MNLKTRNRGALVELLKQRKYCVPNVLLLLVTGIANGILMAQNNRCLLIRHGDNH